jgi:hypothetical protein
MAVRERLGGGAADNAVQALKRVGCGAEHEVVGNIDDMLNHLSAHSISVRLRERHVRAIVRLVVHAQLGARAHPV